MHRFDKGRRGPFSAAVRFIAAALLLVVLGQTGCTAAPHDESGRLVVFAAASMADVLTELEQGFEAVTGVDVRASYGATSDLARQIEDGAPADIFLAAGRVWVDHLERAGRIVNSPVVVARNRLVCVVAERSPLIDDGVADLATLAARAAADGLAVGIAFEGVPAGDFARQALRAAGAMDGISPRLVGQKDVRAVLHAVVRGELAAGFVYASDAVGAAVQVLVAIDPAGHDAIEIFAAVPDTAVSKPLAGRYLDYLTGETGRSVLAAHGFALP